MTLPCVCATSAVSTMVGVGRALSACWSVLKCAAVCCSVLQCAAVCCSVLQCLMTWVCAGAMVGGGKASAALAVAHTKAAVEVVTRCICLAVCCSVLQCVVVSCSVLERKQMPKRQWRWFSGVYVLQCVAVRCNVLQCVAVCWSGSSYQSGSGGGYQVCMSCHVF